MFNLSQFAAAVKAHRKLVVAIGWRIKYGGQIGAENLAREDFPKDAKIEGADFLAVDEQVRCSRIHVHSVAFVH